MPNRGKLVIGLIVGTALIASLSAWWYTYLQGQRVMRLWGAETAYRVRLAPDCDLLRLSLDPTGTDKELQIDGRSYRIVDSTSVAQAAGFVHARQALIDDSSYVWQAQLTPTASTHWTYALRFRNDQGETLLVFDLEHDEVCAVDRGARAKMTPIADGLRAYFREQLPATRDNVEE